jgi:hypothetical protein
MFIWTWVGAKSVGILLRLLVTCRLNAIGPCYYLAGVLHRINNWPASEVHVLTLRLWREAVIRRQPAALAGAYPQELSSHAGSRRLHPCRRNKNRAILDPGHFLYEKVVFFSCDCE